MIDGQLPEIFMLLPCQFSSAMAAELVAGRCLNPFQSGSAFPAAIESYVSGVANLPMLAGFEFAGVMGFVSVKEHTAAASEVYVMGIKRARHRRGTGRVLIEAAGQLAVSQGAQFLTVKTLAPSRPDIKYAATQPFYEAVGFLPCSPLPPSSQCDGHGVYCGTALIQINRARFRPRLGHQRWWHLRRYVTNQTIRTRESWVLSLSKPFAV
jgi:hypothetical protein